MEGHKTFFVSPELCTGCCLCEMACSMAKEGQIKQLRSRVSVERYLIDGLFVTHICSNCKNPPCLEACKRQAIVKDEETGWVTIDHQRCNNYLSCIPACPFRAIKIGSRTEVSLCDICGGNPKCVEVCITGALRFGYGKDGTIEYALQPDM